MDSKVNTAVDGNSDLTAWALASISGGDRSSPKTLRLARFFEVTVFVLSTWLLLSSNSGAHVLERPIQSGFLGLLSLGICLNGIYYIGVMILPKQESVEERLPFTKSQELDIQGSSGFLGRAPWSAHYYRLLITALAIILRIQLLGSLLRDIQCAVPGVEAGFPVLTGLFMVSGAGQRNVLSASETGTRLHKSLRLVGAALIVAWASAMSIRFGSNPRSTLICPAYESTAAWSLLTQVAGVLLDAYILHSLAHLLVSGPSTSQPSLRKAPLIAGKLSLLAATGTLASSLFLAILPQNRAILSSLDHTYIYSLVWSSLLAIPVVLIGLSICSHRSPMDVAVMVTAITSFKYIQAGSNNASYAEYSASYSPWTSPTLFVLFSIASYYYITRYPATATSESSSRHVRTFLYLLAVSMIGYTVFFRAYNETGSGHRKNHPIDALIHAANGQHNDWVAQASHSRDLQDAVGTYRTRYGRHPPPGFDKWYKYATSRNSEVIDDFDGIEENLRPFWKLQPAHIRKRVKHLLSDTSNECAEVSIRNGEATVGQVIPTHRWMVDGIIEMMKPYVHDLPDMDIAFNINDEPRVAVPYTTWKGLDETILKPENTGSLSEKWGTTKSKGWEHHDFASEPPIDMRLFSFRNIWQEYGSVACPPDSPARSQSLWDPSVSCTSCYAQHSMDHFLANWTLAASPCHQPDLANMHGFYLSPSAFKATHELLPIFSQSRAGGFADIVYPTAWNYNDKVKYLPDDKNPDVEFGKKENTVFWHGSATEGFSNSGTWRGQTRQRMVHLTNNSTEPVSVLLPSPNGEWDYHMLTTPEMLSHPTVAAKEFSTAIGFVDKYPRCDNGDCEKQEANFGLFPTTDFQYHWRHKFLLDADGAGFSGRFLPFLQSRSLPFKSAIFREWYDSRITPWKHFVPVDVRLHGLWSTLMYFAVGSNERSSVGGANSAKAIADEGRNWAKRVLRKEDMEIYFYRLLLEYARVTDDDRASLGYSGV